jgi:hypothetical protein
MKTFKDFIAEGTLPRGTQVTVVHKGKQVKGKIVRLDAGKGGYSSAYVVDIGEYESIMVPVSKVKQGVTEGADQKKPTLPPHLLKLIKDKQLDKKPMAQTSKVKDVTPKGYGPNEETNTDRFKKYTRPVVKTTPKIERDTNPSGRTTDHVEWKVTTHTGEVHRHKTKKEAQAHFDSLPK